MRLIRLDSDFRDTGIDLELGEDIDLLGDPVAISQVLINLVKNAVQACDHGAPQLRIQASVLPDRWLLSVEDNGSGIPAELKARIFEPFVTTKNDQGGTGLGLALCYGIAQSHGGTLELTSPIQSHAGRPPGTRATLTLPKN